MAAALELIGLTKRYGASTAVDGIDLAIRPGTYCCLLGPSGCGKTTTLRMIAGHETASEGDILLGAANVTDLPPAQLFVTRAANAPSGVTVLEDVIGAPGHWADLPEGVMPDVALAPEDDATIFYTSGTTGAPKGALGTHRSLTTNIFAAPF
jgi:energy-coupling factor transporter ATP-binding protein EcfA2